MSFYSWLFTKKIANRFFLRVFKLPVPEWFVGQSGSSKVERDYFDDDWNPDLYIMLMWRLFVCHVSSSYNFSYFHSDDDRNVDNGDIKKKKV